MRKKVVTVSSATTSATIPMDSKAKKTQISFACVVSAGGVLTYTVQHTLDDVFDTTITPTWFDHDDVFGETTSQDGNYVLPITAIRLNVTAYTSGSVSMTILQTSGGD